MNFHSFEQNHNINCLSNFWMLFHVYLFITVHSMNFIFQIEQFEKQKTNLGNMNIGVLRSIGNISLFSVIIFCE